MSRQPGGAPTGRGAARGVDPEPGPPGTGAAAGADEHRRVFEVLLACVRHYFGVAPALDAAGTAELNWALFVERAQVLKVVPFACRALCVDRVLPAPEGVREVLERFSAANRLHNRFLLLETHRLVACLAENGIDAIPFKGPLLAIMLYDDLSMRVSGDIDLVVRRSDFQRAKALLVARGYRNESDRRQEKQRRQAHLVRDDGRVIDLHWSIATDVIDLKDVDDYLWRSLDTMTVQSRAFVTYRPVVMLNILCMHAVKERWRELGRACEIARFLRRFPGITWAELRACGERFGTTRALLLGVKLARETTGCRIPPEAAREIEADPALARMEEQVWERLVYGEATDPLLDRKHRFWDLSSDRRGYRLRLLWRFLPGYLRALGTLRDADRAVVRLPRGLGFLYWLIRPVRLAAVYGRQLLRRIRR